MTQRVSQTTPPFISQSERVLTAFSHDWSQHVTMPPRAVAQPHSLDELRACFDYCAEHGLKASLHGAGQSFMGQSLCRDGMVIDLGKLVLDDYPLAFAQDCVAVPANMRLWDLAKQLQRRGVRLPVYTTATQATVGGTLSAGGVSGRSYTRGLLANSVQALTLLATDGTLWQCDTLNNPDIFAHALPALGSAGVILQAKIKIEVLHPIRVQLKLDAVPVAALSELSVHFSNSAGEAATCREYTTDITSAEGFLDLSGPALRAQLFLTMESASLADTPRQRANWQVLANSLPYSQQLRLFSIASQMGFSESIGGWRASLRNLQLGLLNHPLSVFALPVSVMLPLTQAELCLADIRRCIGGNERLIPRPPYFALIETMSASTFEWLRLSATERYVMGIDFVLTYRTADKAAALRLAQDIAACVANHRGRLYLCAYLPDTPLLTRLLPAISTSRETALRRLDPGQLLKQIGT